MKYDKTLKIGNSTIHIVNPPQQTQEEIQQVLKDYYAAAWPIIDELIANEDPLVSQKQCAATRE